MKDGAAYNFKITNTFQKIPQRDIVFFLIYQYYSLHIILWYLIKHSLNSHLQLKNFETAIPLKRTIPTSPHLLSSNMIYQTHSCRLLQILLTNHQLAQSETIMSQITNQTEEPIQPEIQLDPNKCKLWEHDNRKYPMKSPEFQVRSTKNREKYQTSLAA